MAQARKFSKPFGDDIECIAVNHFLDGCCKSSRKLLPKRLSQVRRSANHDHS